MSLTGRLRKEEILSQLFPFLSLLAALFFEFGEDFLTGNSFAALELRQADSDFAANFMNATLLNFVLFLQQSQRFTNDFA